MTYDAVLIHPPAIHDFRKKAIFPGPIAYTVGGSTVQFIMPPVGMLSIADFLDRNGYRVVVDNLGERMVSSASFDVEKYIQNLSAKVYSIGLHWCVHSQGAVEIARLCKRLHPEAMVVLGGLTATVFHEEILRKYPFVDAVIRGEAEKPFLSLMRALEDRQDLINVPNLTFRDQAGGIVSVPLMKPDVDLDDYEFTRLDLLEPKRSIFTPGMYPSWVIPVCRGCTHNCVSCGGSAYSYRTYLGRDKPAFRSPEKIAEDLNKLKRPRRRACISLSRSSHRRQGLLDQALDDASEGENPTPADHDGAVHTRRRRVHAGAGKNRCPHRPEHLSGIRCRQRTRSSWTKIYERRSLPYHRAVQKIWDHPGEFLDARPRKRHRGDG